MNVLFVCIGNTCRSPMAEAVLKKMLRDSRISGVKVGSAGINASGGKLMNPLAQAVLKENGYELKRFLSRRLTPELLGKADIAICMTREIAAAAGNEKCVAISDLFCVEDISDPFGGGPSDYRRAFEEIHFACKLIIKDIKDNKKR